jgi:hypothetical protein
MWLAIFIATLDVMAIVGVSIVVYRNRKILFPKREHQSA